MLTDAAIRNKKPGKKLQKHSDTGGLQLWSMASGSKLWRVAFRFNGKQKLLSLGSYPQIGLLDARKMRDAAKEQLQAGRDPAYEKKLDKLSKATTRKNTFSAISAEWLNQQRSEGKAKVTIHKKEWLLAMALAVLAERPIADISSQEVLLVLKRVEKQGKFETAKRLRSVLGSLFRYAIATARASNDPTAALRGALIAPKVKHRAALTTEKDAGKLLRAIEGYSGRGATSAALRIAPHVFARPGELRSMRWDEVDFDAAVWIIPAEKMKMRRRHKVPLSRQVLAILSDLKNAELSNVYVFPASTSQNMPLSENTLNLSLRKMGFGKSQMTSHGFRALASTLLNESGEWNPDAIERQLAHEENDDARRAYLRAEFWDERVQMMQWWSDRLEVLQANCGELARAA